MGAWRTFWKTIYMLSAVGVGAGCFYAFLFFAFNFGDGLLGNDNNAAAFAVAALAIAGTAGFLFLGRLLYSSYEYIGPALVIIFGAAIFTMPLIQTGSHLMDVYDANRAKPYFTKYIQEFKETSAERIAPLELDDRRSKAETLSHWKEGLDGIQIMLRKKDGTLSVEELKKVLAAIPPARYEVSISIYYGDFKESPYGQYSTVLWISNHPSEPIHCDSSDYQNNPCVVVEELESIK
ncbi:hypothetical protein [Cohnella sp. GCM10012308]|uniref:hypothetical protein n=1 Tax=Cohnella sp. GCM10012308 TaxID=3317329 RepID=UPI00361FB894